MHDVLPNLIVVRAQWDSEASVWVAESADIPGLSTEADTLEGLQAKLPAIIADLIEANGMSGDLPDVPVNILTSTLTRVAVRQS